MRGTLFLSDGIEASWGAALDAAAPGFTRVVSSPGASEPDYSSIEVLYFSGDVFPERSREFAVAALKSENLRWMHTFSAGVDDAFFRTLIERGVRLTTSSGAQAEPIAQTAILYLLALSRDLPGWLEDQRNRHWNPRSVRDLQGLRLGVVGLGPIGEAVARLGAALGMGVTGFRRRPRGDEPWDTRAMAELPGLLPELDALVVAVPLTKATRNLMDEAAFARLKPGALFVNVARGEVVDEDALIASLRSGRLAGAGLDVFRQEPLPEESPLWAMPNVLITPHSSGTSPGNQVRASRIFIENLRAYLRGEPLRNEVGSEGVR
ncbi:MAG TPA: D-2-hydroxyacid dehydrogenase [Myxococcales bacterium]|nr:D-2-hydroxyacid dehydrogenase [Myxococcales bacterium]